MSNDMHALATESGPEFMERIMSELRQERERQKRVSQKMAELASQLKFVPGDKVFYRRHQPGEQRGVVTGVLFRAFVPQLVTNYPVYEVYFCGDLGDFSEDDLTPAPDGPEPDELAFQVMAEVVIWDGTEQRAGKVTGFRYDYEYGQWDYLIDFGAGCPEWWNVGQMEVATNA